MQLIALAATFFGWLEREAAAQRCRPSTVAYYRRQLRQLLAVAGDVDVQDLRAWDLERVKTGWHSVQAAQRLFNWALSMDLVRSNPFKNVAKPAPGCRMTTLPIDLEQSFLRRASPALRAILLALALTAARPQEARALRWCDYVPGPSPHFRLTSFKARDRRRDGQRVRVLPVVPRLARLLARLRRRGPAATDLVFLNSQGRAWTGNALSLAFRRLRRSLGFPEDLVPYSVRHTAATRACVAGVRDKLLAELLGHTSTRTTARYQHPDVADLLDVLIRVQKATKRPA